MKKNKKIKSSTIIYLKNPCPKCKSDNVAEILITQFTEKENRKIAEENLRHDLKTYFVLPEDYKKYYSEYHLNTRCLDCKYEYFSKIQKINRKELNNEEKYTDNVDIQIEQSSNISSNNKQESKLSRILRIIRE